MIPATMQRLNSQTPVTDADPNSQNRLCEDLLLLIEACSPKNLCHILLRMPAFDEYPARFMALHRCNFT